MLNDQEKAMYDAFMATLDGESEGSRLAEELKVPAWRVKNHRSWAAQFTEGELARAFSSARDCERAMKSGSDPDATFKEWLFTTIA